MTTFPGRYAIVERIGVGGMADVFLAKMSGPGGFERPVVLKRIKREYADDPAFADMFLDEAGLVAALRHPNIVQVHELVGEGSELFLVMEYLHGQSARVLASRLSREGRRLTPALAGYVAGEVAGGLAAAHALTDAAGHNRELIHRDVSLDNLLVTYDGDVKVIDFGVARARGRKTKTLAGHVKGKLAYMSPEQIRGLEIDHRSDLFALGVVLWELVTGTRLFARATDREMILAITREPVPPPSSRVPGLDPAMDAVCLRALAKDPSGRYDDAGQFRKDVMSVVMRSGLDELPRDSLATLMQQLFEEERSEREKTLTRAHVQATVREIRRLDTLGSLPRVESNSGDTIPDAIFEVEPERAPKASVDPSQAPARGSLLLVLSALAIAVAGVLVLWRAREPAPAPSVVPATPRTQAVPMPPIVELPPPAQVPVAPRPVEPAPVEKVRLQVTSTPSGATVLLDGTSLGKTPLDLPLPHAGEERNLDLSLRGFENQRRTITLDRDIYLSFDFVRPKRPKAPAKPDDPVFKFE